MTIGIGTLPYMSPEMHDKKYDFKAHIWYLMFFTRLVIDKIIIYILNDLYIKKRLLKLCLLECQLSYNNN